MEDGSSRKEKKPGPLEGIKIVEYGVFHAGPGGSAILADMGAEVVKIETMAGDPMRIWDRTGEVVFGLPDGNSGIFVMSNRNKKGICLDIKSEKGREIFCRLVKDADVFLTNLRKKTKSKLGIDYATLSKVNPRIIHANVSGYGPEGPLSNHPAFDALGQARCGMAYMTGSDDPFFVQLTILDQMTAIAISHAILSALVARERQGIGQEVHVSLYSAGMWLLYSNFMLKALLSIDVNTPWDRSVNSPLRNSFKCKDGKWIVGSNHPDEKYFPVLCEATGLANLIDDPRFADPKMRSVNNAALAAIFDEALATKTADEWMDIFYERGLTFCTVQKPDEVFTDPQALANDYVTELEYPDSRVGLVKIPGYPVSFSANQAGTRSFAPSLGEHTDIVMREMGYSDGDIQILKDEGVIR